MTRDHMMGYMPPADYTVEAIRMDGWMKPVAYQPTSRQERRSIGKRPPSPSHDELQARFVAAYEFETGDHQPDGSVIYKDRPYRVGVECRPYLGHTHCVQDPGHSHQIACVGTQADETRLPEVDHLRAPWPDNLRDPGDILKRAQERAKKQAEQDALTDKLTAQRQHDLLQAMHDLRMSALSVLQEKKSAIRSFDFESKETLTGRLK